MTFFFFRMEQSKAGSTLWKPPFMSRKREETFSPGLWSVFTVCDSVVTASKVLRPGREPVCPIERRPDALDISDSLDAIILSRIFDTVWRRTMTLNEAGES